MATRRKFSILWSSRFVKQLYLLLILCRILWFPFSLSVLLFFPTVIVFLFSFVYYSLPLCASTSLRRLHLPTSSCLFVLSYDLCAFPFLLLVSFNYIFFNPLSCFPLISYFYSIVFYRFVSVINSAPSNLFL